MEQQYKLKDILNWFGDRGTSLDKTSFLKWEMNDEMIHVIPNYKNELIQQSQLYYYGPEINYYEINVYKVKSLYVEIYESVDLYELPPEYITTSSAFNMNYF